MGKRDLVGLMDGLAERGGKVRSTGERVGYQGKKMKGAGGGSFNSKGH